MARRERNGAEMGETTGGRKSAGFRRNPREHAGARKKKGQQRTVDLCVLVVESLVKPNSSQPWGIIVAEARGNLWAFDKSTQCV